MRKLILLLAFTIASAAAAQTIGLSISTLNNPFFVTLRDGAQAAADAAGAELIVVDAQDNVSKQISDLEDLLQRGIDVLVINPTDSDAVVPAVMIANSSGIPVIAVDRNVAGGELAAYVVSDNVAGGHLAAGYICEQLGGSGLVVELQGIPGASATNERGEGFNSGIAELCPDVTVVARQTANFSRAEGLSVMENILQAQGEIDAVFAHNDEMALGALQAITAIGQDVLIVGFDATDDAVAAVEACTMGATVAQLPADLGAMAVEHALEIIAEGAPESQINVAVDLSLVTSEACQ